MCHNKSKDNYTHKVRKNHLTDFQHSPFDVPHTFPIDCNIIPEMDKWA